ncbi:MAG: N-6 DNA methylase, partial [bacterium]|nr:N-6 DNA methylase [bacterium]
MINVDILKQFKNVHLNRPKNNRKFFAYDEAPVIEGEFPYSRSFINKVIECYWDIICCRKKIDIPLRETHFSFTPLSLEENKSAVGIGSLVGNMDAIEAGYYISSIYTKIMPPERRASLGVFYTPPAIVNRLIDNVTENGFDWRNGRLLDPACGGGAFLAPLALKLLKESEEKDFFKLLEDLERRLKGYEIDGFAAWMSMVFLDAALLDVYKIVKRKIKNIVDVRNTLTSAMESRESFDLIIGNPPYGKIFLQPDLRKFYSRSLYGHANLYGLFIDVGLRLCNPGGLIAFITSTSYLGGKYFKSLRKIIKDEAPPVLMDFVEDRKGVFDEVLQETMITLFKKGAVLPVQDAVIDLNV